MKHKWLLLIVIGLLVLVACEEEPTEEPPAIPRADQVTITLPPIVSGTPRFTATLTPSISPTPTITLTASQTPTPQTPTSTLTPSPSPTLSAPIAGVEGAARNIRGGPGLDFDLVTQLTAGDEVGILGSVVGSDDEVWYLITFEDEEGTLLEGWIRFDLVEAETLEVPTLVPTAAATNTPADTVTASAPATAVAFETAVPENSPTPLPPGPVTPSVLSEVNIRAAEGDRGCQPAVVSSDDSVSIFWSWWVTQPELMQDHVNNAQYEVLLNGQRLTNWEQYRTAMFEDPEENDNWTVYWYVPIGYLEPGTYTLDYRLTWSEPVNDGLRDYGPGTAREEETGSCTFRVR